MTDFEKTAKNQTITASDLKIYRITFKINNEKFNFKQYDLLPLQADKHQLFDLDILMCSSLFDLCRIKGRYKRYHDDFIQSYFFRLFDKTQFPIGMFVFIEELSIKKGDFETPPKQITAISSKSNKIKTVRPDYEIYYLESPNLDFKNNRLNSFFLNLSAQYLRGNHMRRGKPFVKENAFACFHDNYGMTFIVSQEYKGLVPSLTSAPNLLPLSLLVGMNLGYKHNFLRLNHLLSNHMCTVFGNPMKLERRYKRNIKELSIVYNNILFFLNRTYFSNQVNIYNRDCYDLFQDIAKNMEVSSYYLKIKEQIAPIIVIINQLNNKAIMSTQSSIRFAILSLAFIILAATVAVSVILGVEPMLRLLYELGLVPPNMLR